MNTTTVSKRAEAAQAIADAVRDLDLDQVYAGGVCDPAPGRNYYAVLFCRARTLDGAVHVYGRSFFTVRWQTAIRALPRNFRTVCHSAEQVIELLRMSFGPSTEEQS